MESIRKLIIETLQNEGQMPKEELIETVYARLTVPQTEIKAEWSKMKKEGIVYCVRNLPGWVGIY